MKKLLCAALCIALMLSFAANAEVFSASTAYEARTKALAVFDTCAFSVEYPGENSSQGHLTRWDSTIRIYIGGSPSFQDTRLIQDFIMELQLRVPMMPNIILVNRAQDSNMQIYFVRLDQMATYVPGYVSGNWGMLHFSYTNWRITDAQIGIATDVTNQYQRNHLIMEEIVGALGLTNDHYYYEDSIVYQPWTTVQQLSDVDWIMLNMLYSPLTYPGMQKQELHETFMDEWSR